MKHDWKESWNVDCTAICFTCRGCGVKLWVPKSRCTFHSPEEDSEIMEKHFVEEDCNAQRVKEVMES